MFTCSRRTLGLFLCCWPTALVGQDSGVDSVLELVRQVRLEETPEHLIAQPQMNPDPQGGWIYWDGQTNDVRLYGPDGELRGSFGREGDGPGEFHRPVGAVRMADGTLVAVDSRGRVSVWSADGVALLDDFNSDVPRPRGLIPWGEEDVIVYSAPVAASTDNAAVPVLHRVSIVKRATEESFFSPHWTPAVLAAVTRIESPPPWIRNDTVFLVLAPIDSLWSVQASPPHRSSSIAIRSNAISSSPPTDAVMQGREQFRSWVGGATFPGRFMPMPDGGWLMQTWALRSNGPTRGLVRLRESGERIWEVANTPQLLAVDRATGAIYLWDPEGLDPGVVQVMRERIRSGSR